MTPEMLPLGDCAVRIAFGEEISPAINSRIRRFGAVLDAEPIDGLTEWVCGYAVVTVYYQPWVINYEDLCADLRQRLQRRVQTDAARERRVEIPVCYGGELGPDLDEVAALHGLTAAQVVQKHCRPRYRVYFLGFLPGFAYLGGLPPALTTPRRAAPRSSVPAGAVGIAGMQTGAYPVETPGGWQIIGRTPLQLYNSLREPPALLTPGDEVKFVPITRAQFHDLMETPDALD